MGVNKNFKKAFTLAELSIALVILPVIVLAAMKALHPKEIKQDAMLKASGIVYNQLSTVTVDVTRKYAKTGALVTLTTLDGSAKFEITDSGAIDKLLPLYKSFFRLSRKSAATTYTGYSGNYRLRNGTFFAMKLYGNCTTTTTTYNPSYGKDAMYEYDTCGAIFYDINDDEPPNILGIDRYIIAFDKQGLR